MAVKTVTRHLIEMLEDLSAYQRHAFCVTILDRQDEQKVRLNAVENQDPIQIAEALVTTYADCRAQEVALETLEVIGCNAQKERLAKALNAASETFVSSYGDIMKVETTGASLQTAQADNLNFTGVRASHAMAQTDLLDMNCFKSAIKSAARKKGVDPAVIAAIISRSCRAGKGLTAGKGCYDESTKTYNTYGLMQLDINPKGGGHIPRGSWDSEEHLCQGIDILIYFLVRIQNKFPEWSREEQLKGGLAAYNAGDGNIHSYKEVDVKTAGGDYSNDVVARAQWYKCNGGF